MVELPTEFKPVEMVELICLELDRESRVEFSSTAPVLQISLRSLISSGYGDTEISKLLFVLLLIDRE